MTQSGHGESCTSVDIPPSENFELSELTRRKLHAAAS